jgi:ABC-type Fe3+/spermidine/putrescine transport system ATPase subunit
MKDLAVGTLRRAGVDEHRRASADVRDGKERKAPMEIGPHAPKIRIGSTIEISGLTKKYGETLAVDDVSFSVAAGEFLTLLGSSGSGKSTTLMLIAGFVEPTAGRMLIGGRDIAPLPPEKRDLGMVFQSYALFPHLDVFDNIAFPLRMRRMSGAEIESRVSAVLDLVELGPRRRHRIAQLSGGQQQRVALARALVFEPPVLLMDEPMGALDRRLREQLQREVKRIQQALGVTVIYVTHDQEEALLMSDRIAIMAEGRIQQIGTPRAIYEGLCNPFVAAFLGESNFLHVVLLPDGRPVPVPAAHADARRAMVRPEDIRLLQPGETADIRIDGEVVSIEFPGGTMRMAVKTVVGRFDMRLHSSDAAGIEIGRTVSIGWAARDMVQFDD